MKHLLVTVVVIFLSACSGTDSKYALIKDNLYKDADGNLYLKSTTLEHFDSGDRIDIWIDLVYCESCSEDKTELKDFVAIDSFHFISTDMDRGGDYYEDSNYSYFHKWMADGGAIIVTEK